MADNITRFGSLLSGVIVGLMVVVAALVGLNYFQGPKLETAIVDTSSISTTPGQRIRLISNQALARVAESQVRISPAAPFTATTSGTTIDIVLSEPLDSATRYTVTVTDVTSRYLDQAAMFTHEFLTPAASVTYLDRADPTVDPSGLDVIRKTEIPDGDPVDLYRAADIQEFERVGPSLVVVTSTDTGGSAVDLVAPDGIGTERLLLPVEGVVSELRASTVTGLVAFTITSEVVDPLPRPAKVLYAVDLAGDHVVRAVTALDGTPLEVNGWAMIPGGTTAAAQAPDESVSVVDLSGTSPATPVGQFSSLRGASPNGSQLLVADVYSAITLSRADGTQTRLTSVPIADGSQPFVGEIQLIDELGTRVEQLAILDTEDGSFTSAIAYADDTITRIVYETPGDSGSIVGFDVSPSGQYVAVANIPDVTTSIGDGAAVDPQSTSVVTTIVEVATGNVVRTVSGFELDW